MVELDKIICGDCLEELPSLPEDSIDAIVTDPPAGIAFMGKEWDKDKGGRDKWIAWMEEVAFGCLRVIKPGGHALVWALPRTSHWTGMAWENAGWEPRDKISHCFGSGFPKSLDIGKALSKRADSDIVLEIKLWLVEQFKNSGKTKTEINKECGFTAADYLKTEPGHDAGGRATWHLLLPYGEKWDIMKRVVGFGNEYDREIKKYGLIVSQRSNPKENREIYGKYSGIVSDYAATPAAKQWAGFGSAIKPAHEDWWLFRKPLDQPTIAANVLRWGCGGLNVDGCRIGYEVVDNGNLALNPHLRSHINGGNGGNIITHEDKRRVVIPNQSGRFPANLIWSHSPNCKRIGAKKVKGSTNHHKSDSSIWESGKERIGHDYVGPDGLEEVESWDCHPSCPSWQFAKAGERKTGDVNPHPNRSKAEFDQCKGIAVRTGTFKGDSGSAARFFQSCPFTEEDIPAFIYQSKASRAEREKGLEDFEHIAIGHNLSTNACARCGMRIKHNGSGKGCECGELRETIKLPTASKNHHPTVKPLSLMRYLCRLITPPGGTVLDPFAGSGTTCLAAKQEGFRFIGIEKEAEYAEIARRRIAAIPTSLSRWEEDARP